MRALAFVAAGGGVIQLVTQENRDVPVPEGKILWKGFVFLFGNRQ